MIDWRQREGEQPLAIAVGKTDDPSQIGMEPTIVTEQVLM